MHVAFDRRVSAPGDVLVRELDGEAVLLNLDTERYYGLDFVGTRMWQVLTASPSIRSAYETLLSEYDVAPDVLQHDLYELVDRLVKQGLLEVHDSQA